MKNLFLFVLVLLFMTSSVITQSAGAQGIPKPAPDAAASGNYDLNPVSLQVNDSDNPRTYIVGENVSVKTAVFNLGTNETPISQVGFYLTHDPDNLVGRLWASSSLPKVWPSTGKDATESYTFSQYDIGSDWYFVCVADYNGALDETDESNNTIVLGPFAVVAKPDLMVSAVLVDDSSIPGTYPVGQTVQLKGIVFNMGEGEASATNLGFYLGQSSSDFSGPIGTSRIPSVWPNTGQDGSMSYTFTSADIGTRYFVCKADKDNEAAESDEMNNLSAFGPFSVEVYNPPPALSISVPAEEVIKFEGGMVDISLTYETDDPATITVYCAGECNESGTPVCDPIQAIADAISHTYSFKWNTSNVGPGTYRIWGVIDDGASSASACAPGIMQLKSDIGPVVLTHGLNGSNTSWGQLSEILTEDGLDVYAFPYDQDDFDDFNVPLSDLAEYNLVQFLGSHGISGQFNIIAHSMGGLIAREYMVNHPARVSRLITLDSPNYGADSRYPVFIPHCAGSRQAFDMLYGSEFIWNLHSAWETNKASITPHVLTIVATLKDCLKIGDVEIVCPIDVVYSQSAGLKDFGYPACYLENRHHGDIANITDRQHNCYKPIIQFLADQGDDINPNENLVSSIRDAMLHVELVDQSGSRIHIEDGDGDINNDVQVFVTDPATGNSITATWTYNTESGIIVFTKIYGGSVADDGATYDITVVPINKGLRSSTKQGVKVKRLQTAVTSITLYPASVTSTLIVGGGDTPPVTYENMGLSLDFQESVGGEVTACKTDDAPPLTFSVAALPHYWEIASTIGNNAFSASLSIQYDASELASRGIDESDLAIAYFDGRWHALPSVVDATNHGVSAQVNHFSLFAVGEFHSQEPGTGSGIPVCTSPAAQTYPKVVASEGDAAIVVWQDARNGNSDIYAQKVDQYGNKLWPRDVDVCVFAGNQGLPKAISDGANGAIIVWGDARTPSAPSLYAQRIAPNGALLWDQNGTPVAGVTNFSIYDEWFSISASGDKGVLVTWMDNTGSRSYTRVQKVDSTGASLWASDGVLVGNNTDRCYGPMIISDLQGGAFASWYDGWMNDNKGVWVRRVLANGNQWAAPLCVANAQETQTQVYLATDQAGDLYVSWWDARSGSYDVYVQKVSRTTGAVVWDENGKPVCTTSGNETVRSISYDGSGGIVLVWVDEGSYDIYAQKVSTSTGDPLWQANGIQVCAASGTQNNPDVSVGSPGSVWISWEDGRGTDYDIYHQILDSGGNALLSPDGERVCQAAGNQIQAKQVRGPCAIFFVWQDDRNGSWDIYGGVRAVNAHAPTLAWPSESGFAGDGVDPSGGAPGTIFEFRVIYKDEDGDSPAAGYPRLYIDANGDGDSADQNEGVHEMLPLSGAGDYVIGKEYYCRLTLVELSVGSYRHRFAALDQSGLVAADASTQWTIGPWVGITSSTESVVPSTAVLFQNYPNPFNPMTRIDFGVPENGYTSLVIYDVKGAVVRQVFSGVLTAGYHNLTWNGTNGSGIPVSSGIYLYKLKTKHQEITRKMVLLR
jgi:pimeloyl-ACP methyl ester carboxylesterase